ncbi:hypothetical protein ACFQS7_11780 [Dankookia sp. GCM10030260]|uniref:hypothetical protein n=1 Tax=Dankookia sp. GCM10030260 TaxID=3273390 RepID=UPI00360E0855
MLAGAVAVDPEALDRDALHAVAHGVPQPRFAARRQRAAEHLEARPCHDDRGVALELPAILDAARIGRISTLLLVREAARPAGRCEGTEPLDASAAGAPRHDGDVQVLTDDAIPAGAAAAAILRY